MQKIATKLNGLFRIQFAPQTDFRGTFVRTFCKEQFQKMDLHWEFCQHNISKNLKKGTLRGMHFQQDPHGEIKVISCISGRIFDVLVDVRPQSLTFGKWQGFELSAEVDEALYVPEGFAHGFLTLEDNSSVHYLMSTPYVPSAAAGVRHDDLDIGIAWPETDKLIISEKDQVLPTLKQFSAKKS